MPKDNPALWKRATHLVPRPPVMGGAAEMIGHGLWSIGRAELLILSYHYCIGCDALSKM